MSESPIASPQSKLLFALLLSLAVNFLLAGYLIGRAVTFGPPSPHAQSPAPAAANSFGERLKQLPGDDRLKFQQAMQAYRADIRQAREDLAAARTRLSKAMADDSYDPDKMRLAFADVRAKTETLQGRVQDATAQALTAVSPEIRKRLAGP